jgi:hypothetical protein
MIVDLITKPIDITWAGAGGENEFHRCDSNGNACGHGQVQERRVFTLPIRLEEY